MSESDRVNPMDCPECHKELVEANDHDIVIDICSECQGIWFDRGELEAYSKRAGRESIAIAKSHGFERGTTSPSACPRCRQDSLTRGSIQSLEAGVCSMCEGVWLSSKRNEQTTLVESDGGVFETALELAVELASAVLGSVFD